MEQLLATMLVCAASYKMARVSHEENVDNRFVAAWSFISGVAFGRVAVIALFGMGGA